MNASNQTLHELRPARAHDDEAAERIVRATLLAVDPDGSLRVVFPDGAEARCDWLDRGRALDPPLSGGDRVLVAAGRNNESGVVIGRIGPYRAPAVAARVTIEATEAVSLKCGESSIELRADGKLMVKGEDVLVKARGTQRIKAGTVNIN